MQSDNFPTESLAGRDSHLHPDLSTLPPVRRTVNIDGLTEHQPAAKVVRVARAPDQQPSSAAESDGKDPISTGNDEFPASPPTAQNPHSKDAFIFPSWAEVILMCPLCFLELSTDLLSRTRSVLQPLLLLELLAAFRSDPYARIPNLP